MQQARQQIAVGLSFRPNAPTAVIKTTDIFAYYKKIALFCHAKP